MRAIAVVRWSSQEFGKCVTDIQAGAKSNLIISLQSYTPNIHCIPSRAGHPVPNGTICAEISDGMEATTQIKTFGSGDLPGAEVSLPRSLNLMSPEGSCEMIVNSKKGIVDTSSWFEIYKAVKALEAVCVAKGEGGISSGQGVQGSIFVALRSGSQAATEK
ncbi:hypothetical protein ACLMJK_000910 [Lecanora helva]